MKDITPKDSFIPVYLLPPTQEEIKEQEEWNKKEEKRISEEKNKEDAKIAALQKLSKIGLTEEEAKAIVGL